MDSLSNLFCTPFWVHTTFGQENPPKDGAIIHLKCHSSLTASPTNSQSPHVLRPIPQKPLNPEYPIPFLFLLTCHSQSLSSHSSLASPEQSSLSGPSAVRRLYLFFYVEGLRILFADSTRSRILGSSAMAELETWLIGLSFSDSSESKPIFSSCGRRAALRSNWFPSAQMGFSGEFDLIVFSFNFSKLSLTYRIWVFVQVVWLYH